MDYKIKFVTEDELSRLYNSGELAVIYEFEDDSQAEAFADQEIEWAKKIENLAADIWGEGHVDASYDSWADKTTRLTVSERVVDPKFIEIAFNLIKEDNFERCIVSLVVEDVVAENFDYKGRFAVYKGGILVELELKDLWEKRVSSGCPSD